MSKLQLTFNQRTPNSPSRAGTEIILLFAPTTSSRNYELLYWKRLQILILGHGCSRACSSSRSCTYIHAAEISEFLGQLFACINRRVTSHVMQSQIACLVLRFVTVVYHLACGFRVSVWLTYTELAKIAATTAIPRIKTREKSPKFRSLNIMFIVQHFIKN